MYEVIGDKIVKKNVPALTALNERLRDDYIEEIADGVARWQRVIDEAGIPFKLTPAPQRISPCDWEFCRTSHQHDWRSVDRRGLGEAQARMAAERLRTRNSCSR